MITTPTLLVDEEKCRRNIRKMATKAEKHNLIFRPHFKTHHSHRVAQWYKEAGVTKITCSSFGMASYFVEHGWKDITVAFPVNVLEIEILNHLAARATINIVLESNEAVDFLADRLVYPTHAFIKIDVGTQRTGISSQDLDLIKKLVERMNQMEKVEFSGFLAHAGHSYNCRGQKEILNVHADCMEQLVRLKNLFPDALISYGDTPTCSVADSFDPVDELRPGNFCFHDLMQYQIGSCSENEIAVAVACPVVAKHPERDELVIYGGGIHFSKDSITEDGEKIFGRVVPRVENGWGSIISDIRLDRLSQEHGIIKAPKEWIEQQKIGDLIYILPIHSCMTMNALQNSFNKV